MSDPEVFTQLASAAWRDTARMVAAAIARHSGDVGEAWRAIAHAAEDDVPPAGVAALAQHFADRLPEPLRATVCELVEWELYTYRGGRKVEATHRLEPWPTEPADSAAASAPASAPTAARIEHGFSADALALDRSVPHSMGDISHYANNYLGATFVEDAIEHARAVELHNGTAADAITAMRARGCKTFHHLATPKLHFQILLADDLRYAIACDDGPDMFGHLEKVLRAAKSKSGNHLEPAQLTRVDHRRDEAAYRPARFRRCFESSGAIPSQVTIGFKNALLATLAARARMVDQLRALQAATLPAELAGVRDVDPRELLHSRTRRAWLAEVIARTPSLGLGAAIAAIPAAKLAVSDGPDDFLDHSRLAYRDAAGRRRDVLLVRNPYGEAAVAMGTLFRDCGVEDVLVYGTAASLDRGAQVGELHFASHATSPAGEVHELANVALSERFAELHAQPGTRVGSRIVNVRSPLDEFDRDVDRLRAAGHQLIEMELAGLLRGLRGAPTRVAAVHVVSDVPQSADTLDVFSPARAARALDAAADVWVLAFGIAEPARA